MKPKTFVLLCCLFWLGACTNSDLPLPTSVPTAEPIIPNSPTTSPISSEIEVDTSNDTISDPAEIEALLQEADREVCQEVIETKTELDTLISEGKDVTELATAVAELAVELENCAPLLAPTPDK